MELRAFGRQGAHSDVGNRRHPSYMAHARLACEIGGYLTDDTQWHFIGDRTLSGKDMVRQWLAETYREPPDFKVNHFISEGDWLTALGEITSKDDEGNEICYAYCDVWRFEGDKLAELRAFVIRPTIPE
jgi:ketosteroid isomerase-like protein